MPQIIKGSSDTLSNVQIGLIGMVPYIAATIVMIWWSRRSDRARERKKHNYIPLGFAAVGLFLFGLLIGSPILAIACICVTLAGLYSFKSPFWMLPRLFLTRSTAVVAIAAINSIGNLGGFVGPYALGYAKDSTGSNTAGLIFLSALLALAFLMTVAIRLRSTTAASEGNVPTPAEISTIHRS